MLTYLFLFVLLLISAVTIVSKLFFLAPTKAGVLVMLSNVIYETLYKKFSLNRWKVDLCSMIVLGIVWLFLCGPWGAALYFLLFGATWGYALNEDARIKNCDPGIQDEWFSRYGAGIELPVPHPKLVINIKGPVWARDTLYDLRDWPLGHSADFSLIILNASILRAQFPLRLEMEYDQNKLDIHKKFKSEIEVPLPGDFCELKFRITAKEMAHIPTSIHLKFKIGSCKFEEQLSIRSIFQAESTSVSSVFINRWKGGSRAAFGWRGDMDLYDPSTFQSPEGMKHTLDLGKRYRIASTMYLSGRLSLVKSEHEEFCRELGVDRDTEGIDRFVDFMKNEVSMGDDIDFPYNTEKQYAIEIGNHMYLHYGTHAAMDKGNQWKMNAWMGDGTYPWQSAETGSFSEQRDNIIQNKKIIEEKLGVTAKSWGVPGRVYDEYTPQAVAVGGMEVGSDTNASAFINVMKMPQPHHPDGAVNLVELTKKYPGDPNDAYKVAMLKYWMGHARRTRKAFIFMAHHHLLRYQGVAGTHCAEEVLRYAISTCKGDFYVSTLLGIGRYWERVLCPKHRWVSVAYEGNQITVNNTGDQELDDIPLEITFANGKEVLVLKNILPGQSTSINLAPRKVS